MIAVRARCFPSGWKTIGARTIRSGRSMSLSMSLIWPISALAASSRRRQEGRPLSSCDAVEDLRLRIPQWGAVEPASGAGVPAQHRAGLADRPPDAGLQDP